VCMMNDHIRTTQGNMTKGNISLPSSSCNSGQRMKINLISYYDKESSLGTFPWTPCVVRVDAKGSPKLYLKRPPSALLLVAPPLRGRAMTTMVLYRSYSTLHVLLAFPSRMLSPHDGNHPPTSRALLRCTTMGGSGPSFTCELFLQFWM
jgi:hypothetical protein